MDLFIWLLLIISLNNKVNRLIYAFSLAHHHHLVYWPLPRLYVQHLSALDPVRFPQYASPIFYVLLCRQIYLHVTFWWISSQPLGQSWIMPLIDKAVPVPDVGLIHQHQCFVTTPVQVNGLALQWCAKQREIRFYCQLHWINQSVQYFANAGAVVFPESLNVFVLL